MDHDVTPAAPTGDPQGDNADQAQRLRMAAEQEAIDAALERLRRLREAEEEGAS